MFGFGKKKQGKKQQDIEKELGSLNEIESNLLSEEDAKKKRLLEAQLEDMAKEGKITPNEAVGLRFGFFRDGYRSMIKVNMFLAGLLLVQFGWNVVNTINTDNVVREYFSVDDEGRIIPIYPANIPIMTPKQVNYWLIQALSEIYDMSATNYRQVVNSRIPQYFTNKGLQSYKTALTNSDRINSLVNNQLMMSAVPSGTPVIYDQGVIGGRYFWRIRLPLRISYQGNGKIAHEIRLVDVLITRVNTQQYPSGIAINQLVESDVTSDQELR